MIGIKSASQIPISNTHFLRNILTKSRSCNGPQYMNLALILETYHNVRQKYHAQNQNGKEYFVNCSITRTKNQIGFLKDI